MSNTFRFLHTSDWHLGRQLLGQDRHPEFEQFLAWLKAELLRLHREGRHVDALIIAGDLYNTGVPSSNACKLYNDFVTELAADRELHPQVIAVAGNHDANRNFDDIEKLIQLANVKAVGSIDKDNLERQVMAVEGANGKAIVMAVPFLMNGDMRFAEANDSQTTREEKLQNGIREHYAKLTEIALARRQELGEEVPLIATGHLFTTNSEDNQEDSGEEPLYYIGTALQIDAGTVFSNDIDYVALGHLHKAQRVGGQDTRRYCGSPLPMGVGEVANRNMVCLVECVGREVQVQEIAVPRFQHIAVLKGSVDDDDDNNLQKQIARLRQDYPTAWVQLQCTNKEYVPNLEDIIAKALKDSEIKQLGPIKATFQREEIVAPILAGKTLQDFTPVKMFRMMMDQDALPEADQDLLLETFYEVLEAVKADEDQEVDAGSSQLGSVVGEQ